MASLGLPIRNDSLYPDVVDVAADDFSSPLALLAERLEFDDPVSGTRRRFRSGKSI
jgi:tRNA pseudouridine32 synthase/23S rRNA pseudouridine746 synthase